MRRFMTLALVLAAGAAGCTAAAPRKPVVTPTAAAFSFAPKACRGGTYTWSGVKERKVVTAVTAAQTIGPKGGKFTEPYRQLRNDTAEVTAHGPALDLAQVEGELAVRLGLLNREELQFGDNYELARPGDRIPAEDPADSSYGPGGRTVQVVQWAEARIVDADFRYACRGAEQPTVTGHVHTWYRGHGRGSLGCQVRDLPPVAREAARLSCRPGDPAVTG